MEKIPVGYKAICEKMQLKALPHFRESYITKKGRGKTIVNHQHEIHIYPKQFALKNDDDVMAQLEFALKHDGINLEIIKALFHQLSSNEILQYIKAQPTGVYARKVWFLYEFLMDVRLDLPDCRKIKYVNLLDPKMYFTCEPLKSSRHAVNNNLLGNKVFCPFVRRTESIEKHINAKYDEQAKLLLQKYDPYTVARACNYLYTKETMSSYQIEREQPDKSRIARFVSMLQQAATIEMLSKEKLIELQNVIVDPRFKDTDYRKTQNYVGETINLYMQKLHYISPKPEDLEILMDGLLDSLNRMLMSGVQPVIIAATIAFGFVFIHPFEDGNGRIHRFLIHYILSRSRFTPKEMIFPVSSIMLQNMHAYDGVLESYSKPLLTVLTNYDLSDDGVLLVKQESLSFYQYIDFTVMIEYVFSCIEETVHNHIEREIKFLLNYDKAKKEIQNLVDMPDNKIDLLIKCVLQNNLSLSMQKRGRFFSMLTDEEIRQSEKIIGESFQ